MRLCMYYILICIHTHIEACAHIHMYIGAPSPHSNANWNYLWAMKVPVIFSSIFMLFCIF